MSAVTRSIPITSAESDDTSAHPAWWSSRGAVFCVQIVYVLVLGIFVVAYRMDWIDPRLDFFGPVPFLVPWFGAVGGVVLSLSGIFEHRRDWDPDYCYWHWARPIVGAMVGTVSVLIFQSGILAVGGQLPADARTGTAKNLLYYLVAFVVGYREDVFRVMIKRLADLILTSPEEGLAPTIDAVDPPSGRAGEETPVIVTGSGLTGTTSVKIGGEDVHFTSESDTHLTVTVPATIHAGSMTIIVTTKKGSATAAFTIST